LVAESLRRAGQGALFEQFLQRKARLEAEGLFDPARKRALPYLPLTIGVVTSPTGAVIRDILHRLADRFPTHVIVWPVLVQGNGAAEQVANALRGFSELTADGPIRRPDLVIVARGGGSIEDLWSFNEEAVVRAIAASAIPTISAVGHETDTTLADHAADRRAPTPTAAAEIAVPVLRELAMTLADFGVRQQRCALRPVTLGRERLEARAKRLPRPQALLAPQAQKLDELSERLRRGLRDRAAHARERLQHDHARLSPTLLRHRLERGQDRLAATVRLMMSLNPDTLLGKGYVRVTGSGGRTLVEAAAAKTEAALTLHFRDGPLDVAPLAGEQRKPRPVAPAKRPVAPPRQDDLFG
jgi:exodeoxyribonuclease VII large subunit